MRGKENERQGRRFEKRDIKWQGGRDKDGREGDNNKYRKMKEKGRRQRGREIEREINAGRRKKGGVRGER